MKKHLDKKNLCIRTIKSYNYKDEDLYNLSLNRIKCTNNFNCKTCNKNFSNNNNLKRHIEKSCIKPNEIIESIIDEEINTEKNTEINTEINTEKNTEKNTEIICSEISNENSESIKIENPNLEILAENIDSKPETIQIGNNNINNINSNINSNNISININITKSFDDDWDTSNIDINKKLVLLLTNSKFTKTLENILENEVNLNVLIDNNTNNGIVFNNNQYVNMNVKDIVKQTMIKLHKHLTEFHTDITYPNILDIDKDYLDCNLKNINNKFNKFQNDKDIQNTVKDYITYIYNKKKVDTIHNYIHKPGY